MNITKASGLHIIKPLCVVISIQNNLMRNTVIRLFFKFYLETGVKIACDAYGCTLNLLDVGQVL